MGVILDWASGIFWTLTYFLAIYFGVRKKAYSIPSVCICLNFSWELWVVLTRILEGSPLNSGFVSQIVWLLLDIGVLLTWFKYATDVSNKRKLLLIGSILPIMAVITIGFRLWEEAAFIINFIMSVFFLFKLDKKVSPSLSIAIFKCIGTLFATILNGVLDRNIFIFTLGGLCFIADFLYICEVWMNYNCRNAQKQR